MGDTLSVSVRPSVDTGVVPAWRFPGFCVDVFSALTGTVGSAVDLQLPEGPLAVRPTAAGYEPPRTPGPVQTLGRQGGRRPSAERQRWARAGGRAWGRVGHGVRSGWAWPGREQWRSLGLSVLPWGCGAPGRAGGARGHGPAVAPSRGFVPTERHRRDAGGTGIAWPCCVNRAPGPAQGGCAPQGALRASSLSPVVF